MIDFSTVRHEHREIDARLANWGRYCDGRGKTSDVSAPPMFAMYQAPAMSRSQYGVMTASFTNVPLSSQDIYEPDVKAFRVSKDYSVWSTN